MPDHQFVLTLSWIAPASCRAFPRSSPIMGRTFWIAQQFDDLETGNFFMRVVFNAADLAVNLAALQTEFTAIAERFGMDWSRNPTIASPISCIAGEPANLK